MSLPVSLIDVARVAKVAPSTASRVLNGKAGASRISLTTQARVSAAARQLGFKPDPQAVDAAHGVSRVVTRVTPGTVTGTSQRTEATGKTVVLMLSSASTTTTLALIPGLEAELVAANYRVTIIVVPADPVSIQNRVARLPTGMAGILACTAIYPAVSAAVAGACPVLVLWQGAAKAVMNSDLRPQTIDIRPRPVETMPSAAGAITGATPPPAATPKPTPVMPPAATPRPVSVPIETPNPVVIETQTPAPATVTEPEPAPQPEPVTVSTPVEPEIPVSTPEPVSEPESVPEPIVTPDPVILETQTPEPATVAEPEPAPQPEPIAVSTPVEPETPVSTPEPVPETESIPEPIATPELVIMETQTPAPATVTEPEPAPQPEPIAVSTPVEPVYSRDRLIVN